MDSITLENYRCFRERQTVRLAPLTLLVGENSTGKTSFLALIRALWDVAVDETIPDFREAPYDLGSFRDIAHHRGARGGRADFFEAGFEDTLRVGRRSNKISYSVRFQEQDTAPYPASRKFSAGGSSIELRGVQSGIQPIDLNISKGCFTYEARAEVGDDLFPMSYTLASIIRESSGGYYPSNLFKRTSVEQPGQSHHDELRNLSRLLSLLSPSFLVDTRVSSRPFAGAPVRSNPHRTYDPTRPTRDSEGENIPTRLANLQRGQNGSWDELKSQLEDFGKSSGLFSEIRINFLKNKTSSAAFEVHVRKFQRGYKGPWRNLIDVGYGVSQALPILTELLVQDAATTLLLQQPEVHLHPNAQAALGTLFCSAISGGRNAPRNRQLIIETHSDYIMDRVRMGVRDRQVRADDVSFLFFEHTGLDVKINSVRIDEKGDVLDAPPSYRQFFLDELERSIGS